MGRQNALSLTLLFPSPEPLRPSQTSSSISSASSTSTSFQGTELKGFPSDGEGL